MVYRLIKIRKTDVSNYTTIFSKPALPNSKVKLYYNWVLIKCIFICFSRKFAHQTVNIWNKCTFWTYHFKNVGNIPYKIRRKDAVIYNLITYHLCASNKWTSNLNYSRLIEYWYAWSRHSLDCGVLKCNIFLYPFP